MNEVRFLFFLFLFLEGAASAQETLSAKNVQILDGHQAVILSLAISSDGKTAATGSNDRFVILWDTQTGKEKQRIRASGSGITALAFSPDNSGIASGSKDKDIVLWNTATGAETARFPRHTATVTALAFNKDGKLLAFGLENGQGGVWNVAEKKPLHPLNGHSKSVTAAAFSGDANDVVFASEDKTLSVWNADKGKKLTEFKEHRAAVQAVAFAPGRAAQIISGSADRTAILWEARTGKVLAEFTGHIEAVNFVRIAPDRKTAYTASSDKTFIQWDTATGKELVRCQTDFSVVRAAMSRNAEQTVAAGTEQQANLFRTESLRFTEPLRPEPEEKNPSAKLPQSKPAAYLKASGTSPDLSGSFTVFHPDGKFAVSAGGGRTGSAWNIETQKNVLNFSHTSPLTCVAFQPKGVFFAAGASDGSIVFIDSQTGKTIQTLKGHTAPVNAVVFSSDGKRLFSAGSDKNIILWDTDTGRSLKLLTGHQDAVNGIALFPDGTKVLSVSADKTIRLWEIGGIQIRVTEQKTPLVSVVISPNGTWFAAGNADNTITVMDTKEFKTLKTLNSLITAPQSLAVSPDGYFLATGGTDGIAVLWDIAIWKPFRAFPQIPRELREKTEAERKARMESKKWLHGYEPVIVYEPVRSIAFSKDSFSMLTSGGKEIYLWDTGNIEPPSDAPPEKPKTEPEKNNFVTKIPLKKTSKVFSGPVLDAAFNRDGSKCVVAERKNRLSLVDVKTGKIEKDLTTRTPFQAVQMLPDNRTLLGGGESGQFFSINTITDKEIFVTKTHTNAINALAVTPGGTKAITGGNDRIGALWDVRQGKDLGRLNGHKGAVLAVALNRDGSKALTGSDDRTAILWDTKTLKPLETLSGHKSAVQAVAFSSDGNRFLAASQDGTAIVYQTATKKELQRLPVLGSPVIAAEFNTGDRFLVLGLENGNAVLFDAETLQPVKRWTSPVAPLKNVKFSNDGKLLLLLDPKNVSLAEVM